jgi:ABC-type Fe3+-hydroxamate transport system substrate-binding protein
MTGKENAAKKLAEKISEQFINLKSLPQVRDSNLKSKKSAYLIWHNPIMTIGSDTFIHHIMEHCGFENVFADKKRYPEISEHVLAEINPEIILLSSEPFPFREKHIAQYKSICPASKIIPVDGQMFSWYGSRLQFAPEYFLSLIRSLAE